MSTQMLDPAQNPFIRIHAADDVVIARQQLLGGTVLASLGVTVSGLIPPGHKIAVRAIKAGEPVRRYNQIIGIAKSDIAPGQHVHTHNLAFGDVAHDYAVGEGVTPTRYVAEPGHVPGHRASGWKSRDAQLHRHPDVGELLGDRRARDRRPFPARHPSRSARERIRTSTASSR